MYKNDEGIGVVGVPIQGKEHICGMRQKNNITDINYMRREKAKEELKNIYPVSMILHDVPETNGPPKRQSPTPVYVRRIWYVCIWCVCVPDICTVCRCVVPVSWGVKSEEKKYTVEDDRPLAPFFHDVHS